MLWRRLVGTKVLAVDDGLAHGRSLRVYAFCTAEDYFSHTQVRYDGARDLYRHSIYTCRTLALSERLSPPVCTRGATQVGGVTLVVLNTAETAAELSTVDSSTGASLGR